VGKRVSPKRRIGTEIDELLASDRDLASSLEHVARLVDSGVKRSIHGW
jgi:hypothetical protein